MKQIKIILSSPIKYPHRYFLLISIIFGSALLIVVPPFQTPDENIHFYRAYEVSELKRPVENSEGKSGNYLPLSIRLTEERTHAVLDKPGTNNQIMFNSQEKYDYRYTKSALFDIPLNANTKTFYTTSGSPDYMPLSYAPQAGVVALMRLFDAPIILQLYAVRLLNLSVWILCAYVGIKLFPFKKWTVVGIALLPVAMSQAISPGLDPAVYGLSLIFIALISKAIVDEKFFLKKRHLLAILGISLFIVFGKSVLAALLLLVFIIPKSKISVSRPLIWKLLIFIVPILAFVVWGAAMSGHGAAGASLNSSDQIKILIQNPLHFIRLLSNTFFFTTPSGSLLSESFVGNFGWLDAPMSPFIVGIGYIIIAAVLLLDYERRAARSQFSNIQLKTMSVVAILYFLGVFLAMFIYFTLPDDNHIKGVNGRYYVPLLFLCIPLLSSGTIKFRYYKKFIIISSIFLMVCTILTIIFRYYFSFIPT